MSSTDEEARKKINKGIIHGLPLSAVTQVAHMIDEVASSRLSKQQLIVVEKALFELTRQQKASQNVPVEITVPNFSNHTQLTVNYGTMLQIIGVSVRSWQEF